ncbi:MAG: hypothetical protein Q7S96_02090 [bacterium]|nr:hypothetical protein [bacterium]
MVTHLSTLDWVFIAFVSISTIMATLHAVRWDNEYEVMIIGCPAVVAALVLAMHRNADATVIHALFFVLFSLTISVGMGIVTRETIGAWKQGGSAR